MGVKINVILPYGDSFRSLPESLIDLPNITMIYDEPYNG